MFACVGFIFLSLVELAVVNYLDKKVEQRKKKKDSDDEDKLSTCTCITRKSAYSSIRSRRVDFDPELGMQSHTASCPLLAGYRSSIKRRTPYGALNGYGSAMTESRIVDDPAATVEDERMINAELGLVEDQKPNLDTKLECEPECNNSTVWLNRRTKRLSLKERCSRVGDAIKKFRSRPWDGERIDTLCQCLFPGGFILFNVVYWLYFMPQ